MSIITSLNYFIFHCDRVICELNSARNMKVVDACTSNNSLVSFGVSLLSSSQNYSLATAVDHLQAVAMCINEKLCLLGIFQNYACNPIGTNFTGACIWNEERSEHEFFENHFSNRAYSHICLDKMNTLSQASDLIISARQDAFMLRSFLGGGRNSFCEPSFSPTARL